jgi:hypothetical protein
MKRLTTVSLLPITVLALACEGPLEPLDVEEGCQPLVADCMLPFPSDFFRVPDASMPSGFRVELPDAAKPITDEGYSADILDWRPTDGFSRTPPIVAVVGEVGTEGLVGVTGDPALAARAGSKTLLMDADTGELIPHYVDVDPRIEDRSRAAVVLRPVTKLKEMHRYVVGLRALLDESGAPVKAPEGFRRLRDRRTSQDPALEALVERYEAEVFAPLIDAGVARDELVLAWDFTTGSDEDVYTDMLTTRQKTLEWLESNTPTVVIDNVREGDDEGLWRTVFGRVTGPLFLEHDSAGSGPARDERGEVVQNGELTFPFTATIPVTVRDQTGPGPAVLYGHGFFGDQDEVESDGAIGIARHAGAVMFAINWQGMSVEDIGITVSTIGGDVANAPAFTDRVPQAMANWLVLTAALEGPLKSEAAFQREGGELVYDDEVLSFIGISQGHILGGVLSALHPRIERSVLQVGGAGLSHMMFRALPFERFLFLMDFSLPDYLDQQKLSAMFQRQFDRIDPSFWSTYLLDEELPMGPTSNPADRRVMIQMGVGDTQVPNSGTMFHARLLDLPLVGESTIDTWGFERAGAPHEGSGFTVFDFGVDPSFTLLAQPPERASYTHDGMRHHVEVKEQIKTFWETGTVVDTCGGVCELEPIPGVAD